MERRVLVALKIVGLFVIGGMAVAGTLSVTSFLVPVRSGALRIGMAVTIGAFAVMGIFVSVRYLVSASRRR